MQETGTYHTLVRRERECGYYDFILCHCIGVCLGMQTAVIEFARNVLEWRGILFSSNF